MTPSSRSCRPTTALQVRGGAGAEDTPFTHMPHTDICPPEVGVVLLHQSLTRPRTCVN